MISNNKYPSSLKLAYWPMEVINDKLRPYLVGIPSYIYYERSKFKERMARGAAEGKCSTVTGLISENNLLQRRRRLHTSSPHQTLRTGLPSVINIQEIPKLLCFARGELGHIHSSLCNLKHMLKTSFESEMFSQVECTAWFKVSVSAANSAGTETNRSRRLRSDSDDTHKTLHRTPKKLWKNHDKS